MIGLNKIGLNQVQLNRLRLNAPFPAYGKMAGGGGSGDGFPQLPGDVTRWHFGGLTNEMMAAMDDPRIEDADHKGRFLSFKNFAWGGMSGVGGYNQNFNQYFVGVDESNKTVSDSSMKLVLLESDSQKVIYDRNSYQIGHTYNFYIKVTGIEGRILNVNAGTLGGRIMSITEDGIYSINVAVSDSWGQNRLYLIFPPSSSSNTVTIEQLPLYPGALVFDGVDDYGTCDNFPILTKEKGYTVVALRQRISTGEGIHGLVSNVKNWFKDGAFILEYSYTKNSYFNRPVSFGAIGDEKDLPHILTYQTSKSYNGVSIAVGSFIGTDQLYVGKINIIGNCTNAAIWELVFLDHDATEEELTKIKDFFVKTYPWLFPDQAWTVVGKTNEDEDRATIANITGNGNDLVLSNLGFAEGSGYGLYKLNFNNWFANSGSGNVNIVNVVNPHKIVLEQSQEAVGAFFLGKNVSYSGELKISVSNKPSDIELSFGSTALGKVILNEGINIVKINPVNTSIGFFTNKAFEAQNIIIEQIPEYEGYLVTDGVDDRVTSSSFTLNKNWTIVGNWEMLQPEANKLSGIVKQNSLFIYNHVDGLNISINDAWNFFKLKDIRSVNAICSDGRIYLNDWTEIIDSKQQTVNESVGTLVIGILGNVYTSLAFKNLSFYNNQNLSKDDCIKAYNYLQTLKAK
nr:MAG TPA: hypothetical protein [Caudoviricetes sp.]